MLDESLTSEADARAAIVGKTCDLFNIRLSKCGGFIASLRLAAMAHAAGIGYQLGCHPGESGVLSAAGRHWACSVAGIRYCEGSYDRHMLRRRITNEDLTFGYGGRAKAINRRGLGVTMNLAALNAATLSSQDFSLA
jgi:muconate cycloisomerase